MVVSRTGSASALTSTVLAWDPALTATSAVTVVLKETVTPLRELAANPEAFTVMS